jgi:hypothetical protein
MELLELLAIQVGGYPCKASPVLGPLAADGFATLRPRDSCAKGALPRG